ncbi:MAG TPA: HD domain-containing protein [Longimicrobiales bacterium]
MNAAAPQAITVRDPLWDTIRLDATAVRIVDSAAFQRLRYIRQLGLAYLIYPGATHTRFDHAVGVYHLAQRALAVMAEQGGLDGVDPVERRLVPLAALLHDIGHYPYSHAIEELEEGRIPGHHEALVGRFLTDPTVRAALESVAPDGPARIEALIRGRSESPLQGLVSGSLDLDKIEYLKRDARFCGVPYGEVDVDRLLYALVVLEDPETGRPELGVREKGVAALESLLFAKYQMFRNVYWHHAVRAATVMYKRIVADALDAGLVAPDDLVGRTDEALLFLLEARAAAGRGAGDGGTRRRGEAGGDGDPGGGTADAAARVGRLLEMLRSRRLPKRAAEVVAAELDGEAVGRWLIQDTPLKRRVEERLARELGLPPGGAFLDYPEKPAMLGLDLLVQRGTGEVIRLGPRGRAGLIGLPRVADELYQTARVLRLFTLGERRRVDAGAVARLALLPAAEVERRLEAATPLLG